MMATTSDHIVAGVSNDVDGFWVFDRVHAPRALTPLSQDLLLPAFGDGMTAAMSELEYPNTFVMRAVNHFAYLGIIPNPAGGGVNEPQFERHRRAVEPLLPHLATLWDQEWLPSILPGLERLRSLDYASFTDTNLLEVLSQLRSDLVARWRIHGRILLVYLAARTFEEFYREHLEPEDPTEPYLVLHGFATRGLESSRGLWRLSRRVALTSTLKRVFESLPAADLPNALRETTDGQEFLRELAAYLDVFGWRNDTIFELADPMWREDPTRPLAAIQGQIGAGEDADPDRQFQRASAKRVALLQQSRERMTRDSRSLARFDELYAQARCYLPIDEDHNFYIDQMGNAGMRLPVLELARRLVAAGAIDVARDVFMLHLDEVVAGLSGAHQHETVIERRTDLERAARRTPPETLGVPPPAEDFDDPLMRALAEQDAAPAVDEPDSPASIKGIPASPGLARGRARVARSLAEASLVRPGEVLVCEMSLPTWTPLFATISAIVTDTGGVLSHAAIVARECGIPCVVGTHVGTQQIRSGALLTVDGARGVVEIVDARGTAPV